MTAITEITRNGAKSARGLVSVQSRLNQIVDESSSTGKALSEWYQQHNIEIYDQAGQLRSLYDVMEDISKIWGTLTTNEKDYYLNQQAGANQSQNLAALLSNFTAAQEAYDLALNSTGSAMKENAAYAESLEFKQSQLNASFQELANGIMSSDLVGTVLDFANAILQLDNNTGNLLSTFLLISGIGWGSTSLLGASKLIPTVIEQFKNFGEVITALKGGATSLGAAFSGVSGATSALTGFFSSSLPIALSVAAAITALVAIIKALKDAAADANRSLADFNNEISSVNDQLQSNQSRIDEINAMPWNERTSEILNEKAALEKENEELERQLDLLNKERKKKAEKETGDNFIFHTGEYKTEEEFVGTATPVTVTTEIAWSGANAYKVATEQLAAFANQLDATGEIADEQRAHFDSMNAEIATQVEWLRVLEANGESLTDEQKNMIAAYEELQQAFDRAVNGQELLVEAHNKAAQSTALTESEYQRLISLYPQLASAATQTADGYIIQQSALESLMSAEVRQQAQITGLVNGLVAEAKQAGYTGEGLYNLVAAQIQASNTGLNFGQQIAALQQLAYQAGLTAAQLAAVTGVGTGNSTVDARNRERTIQAYMQQGMTRAQAEAKYLSEMQRNISSAVGGSSSGWSGSYVSSGVSSASSAADSARQAQIKALQNERDQIQDTIDAINDKYDAELKAIDEVNDALDDEIELQKILQEMAEAKASKKMVYKDGRFQYVSDMDAVASAQLKLDEYNRKKALKDQKADIERRRQLELQAYNDRLDIINKNLNALQNGFNSELSAWDDYLEELRKKIAEEEELKKKRASSSSSGYYYTDSSSSSSSSSSNYIPGTNILSPSAAARAESSKTYLESKGYTQTTVGNLTGWQKNTGSSSSSKSQQLADKISNYGNGGRASGTQSAPAGITLVGEQGPELRVLNQGDGILPANITRNLWAMATDPQFRNGKMGNTTNTAINVANVTLPNVRNAEDFVAGLKNMAYQRAYARS